MLLKLASRNEISLHRLYRKVIKLFLALGNILKLKSTLAVPVVEEIENPSIEKNLSDLVPTVDRLTEFTIPKPNFSLRTVNLQPILKRNIIDFCRVFPLKELNSDGRKLSEFLKSRDKTLTQAIPSSRNYIRKYLFREELKVFEKKPKCNKMIWYGERESVSYLSALSPQVFAATVRVLNELKMRYRDFRPDKILDFGSGTGMTIWAANQVWRDAKFSIDCIEPSKSMVELAKTLLFDKNNPHEDSIYKNVNFSPYFHKDKLYDVVVTSFSLTEFPHYHTKKAIIKELWKQTKDFLVVIDHGNWNGFKGILAARFLATSKYIHGNSASIVSPCPHVKKCPRTKYAENTSELPCSFSQYASVGYSELHRRRWNYSKIRYSFIILRKGGHGAEFPFHRILDYPMRRSKHIICHFCTPDGNIEKHRFNKIKHKEAYKALRFNVNSGDELKLPKNYTHSLIPFDTYGKLESKPQTDALIGLPNSPDDVKNNKNDDIEVIKNENAMTVDFKKNQFISLDEIEDQLKCPDVYDDEKFNN